MEEGKLQIGLAKTTLEQMLKTGKSLSVLLPAEQLGMMDEKGTSGVVPPRGGRKPQGGHRRKKWEGKGHGNFGGSSNAFFAR